MGRVIREAKIVPWKPITWRELQRTSRKQTRQHLMREVGIRKVNLGASTGHTHNPQHPHA